MPTIPNGILRVRLFINTPQGQWSNMLYYEPASAFPANTDMVALANDLFAVFQPHLTPILHADAAFAGVSVRFTTALIDIEGQSTTAAEPGEQDDSPILPDQDCLEIRRVTGKPGRSNRGRIFISGMPSGSQADGVWQTGALTNIRTLASDFSADITGGAVLLHARHWNRVTNTMIVVTATRPLIRLVSRRDRARHLPYQTT